MKPESRSSVKLQVLWLIFVSLLPNWELHEVTCNEVPLFSFPFLQSKWFTVTRRGILVEILPSPLM